MSVEIKTSSFLVTVNDYIAADLTHSVHTSERMSFKGCRRRWNWLFREYYYPTRTEKYFEFGTAYHAAMEVYYNPDTWDWVLNPYKRPAVIALAFKTFLDKCEAQRKRYYVKVLKYDDTQTLPWDLDPEVETDYKERVELGKGMLKWHLEQVAPFEDKGFRPVKVEVPFEVPVLDPDGNQLYCKCKVCWNRYVDYWQSNTTVGLGQLIPELNTGNWIGLPVTYGGRVDAIMEDELGRYWIVDWKTAARLHTDNEEFLLLDEQVTSYCWALWALGVEVAGFLYHEEKKAFPLPPEPNKSRRLGRLFSVNKMQETTADLYERTVAENDPEAYESGLYADFIQYLRENGPKYYERFQVHRNEAELRSAGNNIYLEACDIVDPKLRIYPNKGRFSCSNCAFRQPCIGKDAGEDYQYALDTMYEKRRYHYWVDYVPSTDTKAGS